MAQDVAHQLQMIRGTIADPDRLRPLMTCQVIQRDLIEVLS